MAGSELVRRRFRVGLVVLLAIAAFMVGIFMVGRRASIFTRKVDYLIHFTSASGLTTGNAVRLAGVTVGNVTEVALSETPGDSTVTVTVSVEKRMRSRIRTDTRASIKTIGLLGDKYIELEGGSAASPEIPPGGEIHAAQEAGIEKLLASGEGLLGDLTVIASSLKTILKRTEQGEGLIGELTSNSKRGAELGSNLNRTLKELSDTLARINSGKSLAGRILVDEKYGRETGESLQAAVGSAARALSKIADSVSRKDSAIGALLSDPESKTKLYALIDGVSQAGVSLAHVGAQLEKGDGALPLLLHDEDFGRKFRSHLDSIAAHLDAITEKLDRGQGALGKLINDPALYDAANDVVVGVHDSWMLRWLVRDRQKRGIEDRYEKQKGKTGAAPGEGPH
jgi:phospholipid/cholesterol/gamma-HCH transport system substrate-binding protein